MHSDVSGEGRDERREEMKAVDSRGLSRISKTKRSVGKAGQENKCGTEWLGSPHSGQGHCQPYEVSHTGLTRNQSQAATGPLGGGQGRNCSSSVTPRTLFPPTRSSVTNGLVHGADRLHDC